MPRHILKLPILTFLFCSVAHAAARDDAQAKLVKPQGDPQSEAQAYCAFVTEQAQAQSDLLRTPNAVGAFTQPETGLPTQLVTGLQLSVANLRKSGITLDAARKNCDLYRASTAVQQTLQYAISGIEQDALQHRLELISQASQSLDTLLDQTQKMVAAQNMTRPMLLALKSNQIKLDSDRADTESKIAAIYTPTLSDKPLKQQVNDKQQTDLAEQRAQARLTRQNNWDVALSVGAHQQINPIANGVEPYGQVTVTYNLASHAIDKHLDRSVDAYGHWKQLQESEVARSTEVLRIQVTANIAAQERRLAALQLQSHQLKSDLASVADAETTAALDFRNQLTTTQLLLDIETGDATYRLQRLKDFLSQNY